MPHETGLDYFGERYYGNRLGRFMSADWAAKPEAVPYSDLHDPQSLNLYSYVQNIPTSEPAIRAVVLARQRGSTGLSSPQERGGAGDAPLACGVGVSMFGEPAQQQIAYEEHIGECEYCRVILELVASSEDV
jgi:RHS repeat-associated protein